MSEALARDGKSEDAVGILQNAVKRYPGDPQLWIGLGNALVDHARGITPQPSLPTSAPRRSCPGIPAAPFFYGLALARSGDRHGALKLWQRFLRRRRPEASWRPLVEQGVAALSASRRAPASALSRDRLVLQVERFGDRLVADLAVRNVEPVGKVRDPAASLPQRRDSRA